jgi:type IV secretion system protein VirB5
MKVKVIVLQALTALTVAFSGGANAQIPVTDLVQIGTHITNQIESIAKWGTQFTQMKTQIEQYQKQYEALTGARGMGTLLNDPSIKAALPQDWQNLLASVKSTSAYLTERSKYPTSGSMLKTNAMFDTIASQNAVMSDLYKKSNQRVAQIESLMAKIDTATDPAAKADLTNRLINEQNAIQANQNLVAVLQTKQKQELESAAQAAAKEYSCKEFKNC